MGSLFFPFPDRFPWLLLLPLFAFLTALFIWNREVFTRKHPFASPNPTHFLERFFSPLLLFISLFFIVFAALEPMGKKVAKSAFTKEPPVSVVFVLDKSASMAAKDGPNGLSRFSAAISWLDGYLQKDTSSYIASLYLLDGQLDKWVHKSVDKTLLSLYLRTLLEMPPQGATNFSSLTDPLEQLQSLTEKQVVYILSDGEDTTEKKFFDNPKLRQWVEELERKGVYIFPVAIGTKEGAEIEVEGRKERTFSHKENLEKLATFPKNVFSLEDLQEQMLQKVKALLPKESGQEKSVQTYFSKPLYLLPLFVGTLLLFLSLYFPRFGTLFPFAAVLFLLDAPLAGEEEGKRGVEMMYGGAYKEAEEIFLSLLPKQQGGLTFITYYNLANSFSLQKQYEQSFFWLSYIEEGQVPSWFAYAVVNNQLLSLLLDNPKTIHTKIRAQALGEKLASIYSSFPLFEQKEHKQRQNKLEEAVSLLNEGKVFSVLEVKEQMQSIQVLGTTAEAFLRKVIEEQEFRVDMAFLGAPMGPAFLDEVILQKDKEMRAQFEKGCAYSPWVFIVPYLDKAQKTLSTYSFNTAAEHLAYLNYLKEALKGFKKSKEAPCQTEQSDSSLQIIWQMEQDDRNSERQTIPALQGTKPW